MRAEAGVKSGGEPAELHGRFQEKRKEKEEMGMKLTRIGWLRVACGQMRQSPAVVALIAVVLLGANLVQMAGAQAVSTTTVQGTVYLANGQAGSGTLHLSWPAFTTANGQAVAADSMTVAIAADGFVSVNLAPNLGATPAGLYYTAVFYMSDGTTSTQYWVVPSAAQASLAQVQSQLMPAAQAVQAVSKAYVDQSIAALGQSSLTGTGGTLSGPLYLSGDPTQALQASDKHYVDTAVAAAVPLSGGNMTGALSTPAVNGVQAPTLNSSQATLQAAMTAAGTSGAMEIPPTYAGTDGFTNPSGVRVTDLRTNGAQQAERSVKEFGAVCDGVTDDTNALQTALNYANAHGVALTIPQGTCKTRTLNWRGESIGGMGKQVSSLLGFPGQDVLASLTDTPNFMQYTRLHDLTIYVDQSVDVSCSPAEGRAAAGSCAINRPLENNSIFSRGGSGLTGTVGTGAGWTVGNCAIAMPAVTGTGGNGLKVAEIENVEIATTGVDPMAAQYTGVHSTHTCGMYLAQWPQWSEFRNIDIRGLNTGIAMPALSGTTPAGLNADSNRWQDITIQATHGFTAASGSNNALDTLVAMAGNSSAAGEAPTGLVLDLASTQQGWTVRNATVVPSWNAVQPQLTMTTAGGAVTAVSVSSEHGLGFDPYGVQVPLKFSGSCTAAATANVNTDGSIGTISVTQGGTGCSATTTASVNVAGTWDTAAAVNLIGGQSITFLGGNLLKGNGGYTVWNSAGSESYGTQLSGGGGTLPGGGSYAALVSGGASTGGVMIGSGGPSAANSVQFSGLAAGSGHNCLQIDNAGYVTNTGSACGSGSGGGTVNSANAGQIAYYTSNGAAIGGMNTVPLTAGGTGSVTAAGALQNLGGISSAVTSQQTMAGPLNANVNGENAVTVFGAKGDCTAGGATTSCTDNHAAIQAAIDAAYAVGGAVYLPTNPATPASEQTVYYVATPINWKGVPIYAPPGGQGTSQDFTTSMKVAIRGGVGQDVLHIVPPGASGYVAPVRSPAVENLGIILDTSTNASASFPTRFPGRPCDDVTTNGTAVITSAAQCLFQPGDAGQNIKVGTTTTTIASVQSGTQATLATTVGAATNVSTYISVLDLPVTQTIGNCAFAFDDPTNAITTGQGFSPQFSNVVIQVNGPNFDNYGCGFFFQGNAYSYAGHWTNVFVGAPFGLAFVPANGVAPSLSTGTGMADFNTFGPIWEIAKYPFLAYGGLVENIHDMQIGTDLYGPQILQSYSWEPAPTGWKIDLPEQEFVGSSCPSTSTAFRISGSGHVVDRLSLSMCGGTQTFQWDANASQVKALKMAGVGNMNLAGNFNAFNAPEYADLLAAGNYNPIGVGNTFTTGTSSNPYKGSVPDRKEFAYKGSNTFGPPQLSRDSIIFNRSHDFLDKGASAYYFNAEDLWMWPRELQGWGAMPVVADTASPTGDALVISAGTYLVVTTANATDLYVGSQIPAGKMRLYFDLRAASATNFTVNVQANEGGTWTNIGCNPTFSVNTTYGVFSCDADATGLAGDAFLIYVGTAATATVNMGYLGIRPWTSDLPTASLQIGSGTPLTANHGTGTSVQHSDGTGTSGACFFASDGSCTGTAGALQNGTTATTQSAGDNSTKVATTAFVLANAGSSGGSFVPQGAIYSANTWTNLSTFTSNGATASIISAGTGACPAGTNSCIQFSGGAGNYTQTLDYTYNTQLPIWTISATYILGTPGSSTWGIGFGFRSNQSAGNYQPVSIRMDGSTAASAGLVYINSGPSGTAVATSSGALSLSSGDTIKVYLTRVYDTISGFVEDVTKGTIQNVSYQYSVASGAANLLPNIGRFSIFSIGGTQTVTSLKFSSGVPKGADVACIGDSKTVGYYASNYAGSWCSLLQGLGYRAFQLAGGYDTTTDIVSEVAEIEALAPKYAVLMIGGNDARNGVSGATYEANIASIVSNLTGAGITVYVATYPVENSGVNMSTLNTWIANPAGCNCSYIDVNNGFSQTGSGVPSTWLAGDSVHPAQVFHNYIAQTIAGRLQSDSVKQQFPYYATP
jgi:hypothetical protein